MSVGRSIPSSESSLFSSSDSTKVAAFLLEGEDGDEGVVTDADALNESVTYQFHEIQAIQELRAVPVPRITGCTGSMNYGLYQFHELRAVPVPRITGCTSFRLYQFHELGVGRHDTYQLGHALNLWLFLSQKPFYRRQGYFTRM